MKLSNTIKLSTVWTRTLSLAIAVFFTAFTLQSCSKDVITPGNSEKYEVFHKEMQKLWADHMQFTFTTVDAFFNNPDGLNGNLTRLLQNQKDIGNAIVPYYGQEAGDALAQLLTEHIELAVPVLTAAQNSDEAALGTALDDWYQNAQDIGDFLAGANPHWAEGDMRDMMKMHIDQTTEYSVFLLQKNYEQAIKVFDEANHHMKMMADDLSEGIRKHFPEKF